MTDHSERTTSTSAATESQRSVILFTEDMDAAEDLRSLLSLADSRPLHPSPEGPGRGKQEPWSDDEVRGFAWTLIGRLAGKVEWGATLVVPRAAPRA